MRISARNILSGTVTKVLKGAVNSEVDLTLKGGEKVVAVITNQSVEHLGLKEGSSAYAILKASWVIIGTDLDPKKISARNVLRGTVARIHQGAVNDEVTLTLSGGAEVTAIITRESTQTLGLKQGGEACAAFKANNVILAVD
jgi:molybdate transport system regulatory protein